MLSLKWSTCCKQLISCFEVLSRVTNFYQYCFILSLLLLRSHVDKKDVENFKLFYFINFKLFYFSGKFCWVYALTVHILGKLNLNLSYFQKHILNNNISTDTKETELWTDLCRRTGVVLVYLSLQRHFIIVWYTYITVDVFCDEVWIAYI